MSETRLTLRLYEGDRLVFTGEAAVPVEFGRQIVGEQGTALKRLKGGVTRLVVAPVDDVNVSRRHALLEAVSGGKFRLTNASSTLSVKLADGSAVPPGGSAEISLPNRLGLGRRVVGLEPLEAAGAPIEALETKVPAPGSSIYDSTRLRNIAISSGKVVDTEAILQWLQTTVVVAQSAATTKDFLRHVARAVVEMGLDTGAVLMRVDGGWSPRAVFPEAGSAGGPAWRPSESVLRGVCEEKRTIWRKPQPSGPAGESLLDVEVVVAAPILDRAGEVIGVVYADRRVGSSRSGPISRVEAMLVELLACSVAAGLARLEQEQAALSARVRFDQFFSPELSRELEANPDLLVGKDAEVSILDVDIRGFSRISERLGPARTVDWIREVITALSECVIAEQGVLVDYVGDEIMAMWGAPKEQPDHAARACRAAQEMLRELERRDEQWQQAVGESVELGIGISTGPARVGNVGSERKFKYGPLGSTVNLASRVLGASRFLGSGLLVTAATRAKLGPEFSSRRLCRARLVNIAEPVDLYEIATDEDAEFQKILPLYEKALQDFEAQQFDESARTLGFVFALRPADGPSRVLMSRVLECLTHGHARFHDVLTLPGK